MSARATNLALFAAVPALVLTGLLAWAFAAPAGPAFVAVHRALAAALIVALAWKYGIAQRSVRRRAARGRWSTLAVGTAASAALLLTLGLGLAWTVGLVSFDRPFAYSLLNVHVFTGVALTPLVVAHAAQRRTHTRGRPRLDRRDLLRGLGAIAGGVVLAALLDRIDASRLATGSRVVAARTFPVTSWTFDTVPAIDASRWRIEVIDGGRRLFTLSELAALGRAERDATLDCTGGWATTQRWSGVPARSVVPSGRGARVTSVTGHTATFAANEVDALLLATHVGDVTLGAEHGAPLRLVAPMHRGFAWIKWVARIEIL